VPLVVGLVAVGLVVCLCVALGGRQPERSAPDAGKGATDSDQVASRDDASKPAEQPAKKPPEKPADKPAERPADKPADEAADDALRIEDLIARLGAQPIEVEKVQKSGNLNATARQKAEHEDERKTWIGEPIKGIGLVTKVDKTCVWLNVAWERRPSDPPPIGITFAAVEATAKDANDPLLFKLKIGDHVKIRGRLTGIRQVEDARARFEGRWPSLDASECVFVPCPLGGDAKSLSE
jgi:hypothetical protein